MNTACDIISSVEFWKYSLIFQIFIGNAKLITNHKYERVAGTVMRSLFILIKTSKDKHHGLTKTYAFHNSEGLFEKAAS